MKKFEKHIKKIADDVRLTPDEKALMRSQLEEYMAFRPVRTEQKVQHTNIVSISWSYRAVSAFLVVALLFTSGVGVTYASEDALPGEYLYPVKEVSEEVRTQLILSDERKAQWLMERAHRRLEEAHLLAQEGSLNDETASLVEERFIKHANRAQKRIDILREKNPARAEALALAFETGAEAHVESLEESESSTDEAVPEMALAVMGSFAADTAAPVPVAEKARMASGPGPGPEHRKRVARLVRAHLDLPPQLHEERVPKAIADPEVAEELVRVLNKQEERLEARVEALPEERQEQLEVVLEEVRTQRAEIVEDLEDGDYEDAHEKLRDVLKATHKTRSQIKTGQDIRPLIPPEVRMEIKQQLRQEQIEDGEFPTRRLPPVPGAEIHNRQGSPERRL